MKSNAAVALVLLIHLACHGTGHAYQPHMLIGRHGARFKPESSTPLASTSVLDFEPPTPELPSRRRIKARLLQVYQRYLYWCETRPFLTKATTAACIMGLGDAMAQHLQASLTHTPLVKLDWVRLGAFMLTDFFYKGPYLHVWYSGLARMGKWMERKFAATQSQQVWAKLLVDQGIGASIFFVMYFYAFELFEALTMMRTPFLQNASAKLTKLFVPVMLAQYRVWPLVSYVNFNHVPAALHVLVVNLVGLFWNIFLCTQMAKAV